MDPTTTVYDTKAIKTTPAPVEDIGWDKLDKKKFFLSSTVFILSVRALVYPIGLIKTRMQVIRVNFRKLKFILPNGNLKINSNNYFHAHDGCRIKVHIVLNISKFYDLTHIF